MSETELPVLPGQITLINRMSKDIKTVKTSFDWPAFFSPMIFGIPHFIRKMWVWAGLMLALQFIPMLGSSPEEVAIMGVFFLFIAIGLGIWLGKNGRSQFVKSLLAQGYELAHPEHQQTKAAKLKWGIL